MRNTYFKDIADSLYSKDMSALNGASINRSQQGNYITRQDNTSVNKVYPKQNISYENQKPYYNKESDKLYFKGPQLSQMYGLLREWRSRPQNKLEEIYGVNPPMWKLPYGVSAEIGNVLEQAGWDPSEYWEAVSSWGAQRDYLASDEYLNRLKNFMPASDAKKLQQKRLNYYDSASINFDKASLEDSPNTAGYMAYQSPNSAKNYVRILQDRKSSGSTLAHEGLHSSQTGLPLSNPSNYIGPQQNREGFPWPQTGGGRSEPFTKKELDMMYEDIKPVNKTGYTDLDFYQYVTDPVEYHVRLGSLRKLAFDLGVHKKYGEKFTKEQVEYLKNVMREDPVIQNDYFDVEQLFEISKGGQTLLNNLNKIAYEEPIMNRDQEFYDQPIMAQNGGRIVLGGKRGYKFY